MARVNLDLSNLSKTINSTFLPLLQDRNRFLVLRGGRGSGKSHFIAQKILLRILIGMSKGIKHKILCIRSRLPAVRVSVFTLMCGYIDKWGLSSLVTITNRDMIIKFRNGSEIVCRGCDDPDKLKSIEGITSIWIEEATELSLNDFIQINLCLRGKTNSYHQIMLSFNPVSKQSWVYKYFYNIIKDNATLHLSTYKDNLYIDDNYKQELESLINVDNYHYMVSALGEWGELENLIYTGWTTVPELPNLTTYCYGLDLGYNHPTALVLCGRDSEKYTYFDELLFETKLTGADLIKKMNKLGLNKKAIMYCDSARPEIIEEIKRAGYNAKAVDKGAGSVKAGIDFCKRSKWRITERSTNLIKEISMYKWKEDKNGNVFDEPVKMFDDLMDACRYSLYSHYGKLTTKLSISWI